MNIGIVTIAFGGYGKFLPQWCAYVAALDPPAADAVVALGKDHGVTEEVRAAALELLPGLKIVESTKDTMGALRNAAVNEANTEWVMYLSIDDGIHSNAIHNLSKHERKADYLSVSWNSIDTWKPDAPLNFHRGRHPSDMKRKSNGRGFIVGHSPFRKEWFYRVGGYEMHDLPNAPFVTAMVEKGARFAVVKEPVSIYLRREDSHASKLGRRGKQYLDVDLKRRAIRLKALQERAIRERKW